jgi:hypothetical protein
MKMRESLFSALVSGLLILVRGSLYSRRLSLLA